jgi:hypothetical protein
MYTHSALQGVDDKDLLTNSAFGYGSLAFGQKKPAATPTTFILRPSADRTLKTVNGAEIRARLEG